MMDKKTFDIMVAEILVEKFGEEKIKGLLTDKYCISTPSPINRNTTYTRHLKDTDLFCSCKDNKHEWCTEPESLLVALDDACHEMSYSNWANDKFDRAAELIIRYCEEKSIPMKFIK